MSLTETPFRRLVWLARHHLSDYYNQISIWVLGMLVPSPQAPDATGREQ